MRTIFRRLRDAFVGGLLAVIPVGATVYLVWFLWRLIDGLVGKNTTFGSTVEEAFGRWIPGMGIYMTAILILFVGFITRNFLGRRIHLYLERAVLSVPIVRKMYGTLKQFTIAVFSREPSSSFKQVVMFEYPKEGINAIGLVTNKNLGKLQGATGEESLLVYAPTAPNPLSGYMLIIPEKDVTYLDIPVEDAVSMILSSGSVLPDSIVKTETEISPSSTKFLKHN